MCEFCVQHGEGKRWYLNARNYSESLLDDVDRVNYIREFIGGTEWLRRDVDRARRLAKAPRLIRNLINRLIRRKMQKDHLGQVVPIEEIEQIFGFVNSIVRLPCICREITLGEEQRYCYGVSLGPDGGRLQSIFEGIHPDYVSGPDRKGLEYLSKEEALEAFRAHETEGLCHSIWTFKTPFICGVCNCDRSDCLALHFTISHDMPLLNPGDYSAELMDHLCCGCRKCMQMCQFGAISYRPSRKTIWIDASKCYGCGVCRAVCQKNAIVLKEKTLTMMDLQSRTFSGYCF